MISLTGWFLNQLIPQKLLFMNIDNMENLKKSTAVSITAELSLKLHIIAIIWDMKS